MESNRLKGRYKCVNWKKKMETECLKMLSKGNN